jgi:signal peptidase I
LSVASALIAGWFCGRHLIGAPTIIRGPSMSPTLVSEQCVRVRALFRWQRIDRGDIVTLRDPTSVAIKRVIGIPGDTLRLWMGYVYLNGIRLEESYVPTDVLTAAASAGAVLAAGPDEYIVMGDNRWESQDSPDYGPIRRSCIRGRVRNSNSCGFLINHE